MSAQARRSMGQTLWSTCRLQPGAQASPLFHLHLHIRLHNRDHRDGLRRDAAPPTTFTDTSTRSINSNAARDTTHESSSTFLRAPTSSERTPDRRGDRSSSQGHDPARRLAPQHRGAPAASSSASSSSSSPASRTELPPAPSSWPWSLPSSSPRANCHLAPPPSPSPSTGTRPRSPRTSTRTTSISTSKALLSSSSHCFCFALHPSPAAHLHARRPSTPAMGSQETQSARGSSSSSGHKHGVNRKKDQVQDHDHDLDDHDHDHDHDHHGHGHGLFGGGHHHHHHDNTYLTSTDKNDPGVRITRIGLLSNLAMAAAKFVGGWAFNSRAMVADAWHSIADLASDILTLATVSWSIKPPTDRFPVGFGKVESMGALGVSGMLIVGGLYMGWDSAITLYGFWDPDAAEHILEHVGSGHGHSHSHSHSHSHGHGHSHGASDLPSLQAIWLAAGTILVKEWLYHATMKIARARKSSVLASNAVHHRVDSLTGFVTLAVILGANAFDNAAWLDPVGGLLISVMVVHAGFDNTRDALYELVDQGIDADVRAAVRKHAQAALADISDGHEADLRRVSGTKSGPNYLVDLDVYVPGKWTVDDVRELEDALRARVGANVRGTKRVRVRFVSRDAAASAGRFDEFIPSDAHALAEAEGDKGHGEDGHGHGHKH